MGRVAGVAHGGEGSREREQVQPYSLVGSMTKASQGRRELGIFYGRVHLNLDMDK